MTDRDSELTRDGDGDVLYLSTYLITKKPAKGARRKPYGVKSKAQGLQGARYTVKESKKQMDQGLTHKGWIEFKMLA